ncbi:MAG: LysM peptidoglycan-binding domain-containing protein [Ruminococcus flavefaciens]|nr:LysM peptidoglycan-binding domain-containing protein [Ruminococcus flavefaciens]
MSNHRSERRIRNNRIRRQKELRKNFLLTVMTLCLVFTFSFTINGFLSNAKDDSSQTTSKYYKSITISNGETLWSIAKDYMDVEHYASVNDYIKEVKKLNSLTSDSISYGANIIVPYYSYELAE